jgi:hypothetical protein
VAAAAGRDGGAARWPGAPPFDGAPLRYRVEAGGAKVYSVGPDLHDDGATPLTKEQKGDLVFTVAAPR